MGKRAERVKGPARASRQCRLTPMSARRFRRPQDRPRVWLSCPSQRPPKPVITSPDGGDQPWRVGGPLSLSSQSRCWVLREKPGKGVSRMRYLFAALVLAAAVFGTAAQAEKRTFIIANNSDGYGVDRCLASGATCGAAVATAYCKA